MPSLLNNSNIYKSVLPDNVSSSLLWCSQSVALFEIFPLVAKVSNEYYQVTPSNASDQCFIVELPSCTDAIQIPFELYTPAQINLNDWLRFYNLDTAEKAFPTPLGCETVTEFNEIFAKLQAVPPQIIEYLSLKQLPWKSVRLLSRFDSAKLAYTLSFIEKEKPSNQLIKQFIEAVTDFDIKSTAYHISEYKAITDRKSAIHKELLHSLNEIAANMAQIKAINADNFETSELGWSFKSANFDDFLNKLETLTNNKDSVKKFYEALQKATE